MNMSNIMFQVLRLNTFVFNKCSEIIIFTITFVVKSLKVLIGIMLASVANGGPALHQHWANVSCYLEFLAPGF